MEWMLFVLFVFAAALYIGWPRRGDVTTHVDTVAELREEFDELTRVLRELDEDLAAGRISSDDRLRTRGAIGSRLRQVVEALRDLGAPVVDA